MQTATDIAQAYFACMRAGDIGVADLFHEHAVLEGLGQVTRGRDAIRTFYAGAIRDGRPQPTLLSMVADERRVFAEIDIQLGNGGRVHAVDLFRVEDGLIHSLTYFIADHPDGE